MVSWMICRLVVLVFGMLYPAYASYKAVKTKNIREYVRWMMYWIVFALFMAVETFTDIFISWFPFYYEIKMAFVLWLLSPYTRGASMLYRKFVHPSLSRHEKEIDTYIVQAKERSYETVLSFGKRGLNIAASAAVQAATKVVQRLLLPCRVRVHWPGGCGASPCRTCAPSPMAPPPPTRIPSTWRTRYPAAGHLSGTGQGACEKVTPIMSVGPTPKWSPSHQPGPERSRWAAARACV
ncbi:receptor expression-enhancing protein 4 isoform X2 [Bubalus bubalis]|uniref:receptor expression-enhancing protein 4 isoform X2 n=1 Tax=Bubalus bubalis TaxID=89462 RepID=UPI001E1B6E79|nr:receptor expression-enhancing protein 4 isoform X2 [Bubalus bubalis]